VSWTAPPTGTVPEGVVVRVGLALVTVTVSLPHAVVGTGLLLASPPYETVQR